MKPADDNGHESLDCWDARSGTLLWSLKTKGIPVATAGVEYSGSRSSIDPRGLFFSDTATIGTPRWTTVQEHGSHVSSVRDRGGGVDGNRRFLNEDPFGEDWRPRLARLIVAHQQGVEEFQI